MQSCSRASQEFDCGLLVEGFTVSASSDQRINGERTHREVEPVYDDVFVKRKDPMASRWSTDQPRAQFVDLHPW